MAGLPLDSVRVLDAGGPLSAYASKLLADLGADVLKLEPPAGDPTRAMPPFAGGGESLAFAYYHGNKRGAVLDVSLPESEPALAEVAAGMDVVVVTPSPDAPVAGLDATGPSLSWAPAIVLCLTPFGLSGPLASWRMTPFTSFAMSGLMHKMGEAGGPPLTMPGNQAWDQVGVHGVVAVLAALRVRAAGGQWIDLAVHDVLSAQDDVVQRYSVASVIQPRGPGDGYPPTGSWTCADGVVEFQVHTPRHWSGFVDLLGNPTELADPALADRLTRIREAVRLREVIAKLLVGRGRDELVEGGQARGVPCGLVNTPRQFTDDAQVRARGFIAERAHPTLGTIRLPGNPFRSSRPLLGVRRPAPELGEHDAVPADRSPRPVAVRAGGPGPLAGIRVLSVGNFVAGNSFAMTLAELGADVVKVESHGRPDPVRARFTADHEETREPSGAETTTLFAGLSRSVRDLSIDLKAPGATEVFRRLAVAADVVFENLGAGAFAGLGLGWEQLREANPRLVMVSVSGYGRTGPRARYLAYGGNVCSFTGLTHLWGQSHGSVYDYIAGTHAVAATLAALILRDRDGQGTYVDVAQTETAGAILGPLLLGHLNGGTEATPAGNAVAGSWCSDVFACRGDDAWVAVELRDAADLSSLGRVLDVSSEVDAEADPATVRGRLADWARERTPFQAARALQRAGVPAAAVQDGEDVWRDPQLRARSAILPVPHPELGVHEYPAPPHRLAATPATVRWPSPRLGADTRDVLARWLGLPAEEVAELARSGIVGTDDPRPSG